MANLQSLLPPVTGPLSAVNPLKFETQQPEVSGRSEADTRGMLAAIDENGAPNFLQLLDSSTPSDEGVLEHVYHGEAEPESLALRGGQAFELKDFSGNQYPFWGNSLPTDGIAITQDSPKESIHIESGLIHTSHPIESASMLSLDVSDRVVDVLKADTEPRLAESVDASVELENPAVEDTLSDFIAGAVKPVDGYFFLLPSDELSESSNSLSSSLLLSELAVDPLGEIEPMLEPDLGYILQPKIAGENIITAAEYSQSMEVFSKFMIEHTRNSKYQNSGVITAFEAPLNFQEMKIDDGGLDGLLGVQTAKLGENLSAKAVTAALTSQAGDFQSSASVGVPASAISTALSQWRIEQDASAAIGIDSLERQGLFRMAVPFNQAAWGESLGSQLSLLMGKNLDSAQIQLDPPELGPLGVKIQLNNDQVSLQFTSAHAVVRDALEQSSQKLQQMLSEEGLDLVDVNISDERQQERRSSDNESGGSSSALGGQDSDDEQAQSDDLLTSPQNLVVDDGKIDYFI